MSDLQYMASRGHRVIGCAQYLLPEDKYPTEYAFSKKDKNYPDSEYCFLGLISLEDPPKHGVREAIGKLRLAGIRVMMVTGALLIHDYIIPASLIHCGTSPQAITPRPQKQLPVKSISCLVTRRRHSARRREDLLKQFTTTKYRLWLSTVMTSIRSKAGNGI